MTERRYCSLKMRGVESSADETVGNAETESAGNK